MRPSLLRQMERRRRERRRDARNYTLSLFGAVVAIVLVGWAITELIQGALP